jgi:predicted HTH transcriptional regulator
LIGFAEISGSGIRAVHRACQLAHRKAPTFESDQKANTFTLTLDWSEDSIDVDAYWRTLVGVQLSSRQAQVLNALVKTPSATFTVLETETGLDTEQLSEALDFLVLQVLVEQDESNFRLAQHLREKLG